MCDISLFKWTVLNELDKRVAGLRKFLEDRHSPRFYQHVFTQMVYGLDAIHSISWVDRDVHPGNISILPLEAQIRNICIKIADFENAEEIRCYYRHIKSAVMTGEKSLRHFDLYPSK